MGDVWILWVLRAVYAALAVFFVWTMYARRRELEAFAVFWGSKAWNLGKRIWRRWGPLLQTKTFWGGLIMFGAYRSQTSLPAEVQSFATDVLFAAAETFGLVLVAIGRALAKEPLISHIMGEHDPDGPIIPKPSESETFEAVNDEPFRGTELQHYLGADGIPAQAIADPTPESVRDPVAPPKRKRKSKAKKRASPRARGAPPVLAMS